MGFALLENSPRRLADLLHEFCDDDPDAVYLHVLDVDNEGELAIPKSRCELLDDARAVASKLLRRGGITRKPGDPLIKCSILARSGYLFFIHFLAAIFNGWTPVLLSTRNSSEAIEELTRVSESRHLIVDGALHANTEGIRKNMPEIVVHVLEGPEEILQNSSKHSEWKAWTEEEAGAEIDFPGWYLHSSGSTGHPKLIPLSHKQIFRRIFDLSRTRYDDHFIIGTMPMFHTIGLLVVAMWPLGTGAVSVIVESKHPITGESFVDILKRYPGSLSMVAPAILDEVVSLGVDAMQVVVNAHRVIYGGAALSQETGDSLASFGVKIVTAFGTTETGGLSLMDVASDDPRDWRYTRFLSPSEIVMKPTPESPELRQMIVRPGPYLSPALVNCQDPVGFITGDLWKEHPAKPGLWLHMGRKGSVTVLSNGEKTDNVQIEKLLIKDPLISAVVVFGEGHAQNGVIVMPKDLTTDPESFLNAIWPTIEHANAIIPHHSRLARPLVLVSGKGKGFMFTDKSTINRKRTIELYKQEIDTAYASLIAGVTTYDLPEETNRQSILGYIRKVVFGIFGRAVEDQADLFDEGMDSLSAITCRSSLVPLLKLVKQECEVPRNLLYHYPTVISLLQYACAPPSLSANRIKQIDDIGAIVEKLAENLPRRDSAYAPNGRTKSQGLVIVLTGSTGSFGSHILSRLLQSSHVAHVFCLNRRSTVPILERQKRSMDDPSLIATYTEKVTFLDIDLSVPELALSKDAIWKIQATASHIIHCAWEVNFNHALERFVNVQITGVRRLMDICLSSQQAVPPRFIFVSSISAVSHFSGGEAIPELVDESFTPLRQGYGQSKYIAERILTKASKMAGLPVTIIRVGQLSGSSETGAWNMNEYIPVLLQTGLTLGMIPEGIPDVRWIPSDIAAGVVLDLIQRDEGCEMAVYHIESPHITYGADVIRWVTELSDGAVKAVPSQHWLDTVQESSSPKVTARKLLEFYESWLSGEHPARVLSTEKTAKVSRRINWGPITKEVFTRYYRFVQETA